MSRGACELYVHRSYCCIYRTLGERARGWGEEKEGGGWIHHSSVFFFYESTGCGGRQTLRFRSQHKEEVICLVSL